jgi:RHS repeat-associated protein
LLFLFNGTGRSRLNRTTRALFLLLCLPFFVVLGVGQTGTTGSATDGTTPSALASGTDNFMSVNPYNGKLSIALPLMKIGGRGSAGYTMTLPIDQTWTARQFTIAYQCMNGSCPGPATYYNATLNWWNGLRPGFGPGVVQGRRVGGFDTQSGNYAPQLWGIGQRLLPNTVSGGNNIVVTGTRETLTRLTFIGPDNSEIELRDQSTNGRPHTGSCNSQTPGFNRGRTFVSTDGSGITFASDSDIQDIDCSGAYPIGMTSNSNVFSVSGYLHFNNGTVYRIDGGAVSWIRDANGNQTTFSTNVVSDPLGRQVTFSAGNDYSQVNFAGVGGEPRTLRVYYAWLSTDLRSDQAQQTYHQLFPEIYNETDNPGPSLYDVGGLVSAVQLPDGRFYRFYYNSYGEVARVELPSGAAIEYDYAAGVDLPPRYSGVLGIGYPEQIRVIYRRVTESRLYPNGGSGSNYEKRTTYCRNSGDSDSFYSSLAQGSVTVDDRDAGGNLLARTTHYYYGSPTKSLFLGSDSPSTYGAWQEGKEYQTDIFAQDGTTLLRRVSHDWQQRESVSWWPNWCLQQGSFCSSYAEPPNDPRIVRTTTTLTDLNLVTKQEFAYDQYNNPTDVREYDFGVGAPQSYPTRHSHTEYLTTNNGVDYTSVDPQLRSLPKLAQVFSVNPTNGSEAIMAQTEMFYDESSYPVLPYSLVTGWGSPPTSARGNVTTVRRWLNFDGTTLSSFPSGTYPASHAQYDQCGQIRKSWDANGNLSQVDYADAFTDYPRNTFAYPTTTTTAVPDPTGTYGSTSAFTATAIYDLSTGLPISTTDGNGKTTTFNYDDPLNRIKTVTRPDTGTTTYNYSDTPGNTYVETLTQQDSTRNIDSRQYFDKLGRPTRALLFDGTPSTPWVVKDTYYDAIGRVTKVSNPYRVSSPGATVPESCSVCTTNTYDSLSRVTAVTTPDGAQVTTAYAGSTSGTLGTTVTVTDQAGKQRKSMTDALGRLINVVEDPTQNGLNYQTSYDYDVLGNLLHVYQGSQTRTFTYDSLSRLLTAANPESGTINYDYDENGNLLHKIDPRLLSDNVTHVRVTYEYDALNRPKTRSYNDGTGPNYTDRTPAVTYTYDPNIPNGKGCLASVSSSVSSYGYGDYDAMGRVRTATQTINGQSGSQTYSTGYTYDLAGHVTSVKYPSNHIVNYNYDNAGRLGDKDATHLAFTGNLGDGDVTPRNYGQGLVYDAASRLTQEQFGTATPIYNQLAYNSRGQLAEILAGTGTSGNASFNRGMIVNDYSLQCSGASCNATDNNGNLRKQTVYVPNDPQNNSRTSWSQQYDYDSLNRLTQVTEDTGQTSLNWHQGYRYDRFGNRRIDIGNTSPNIPQLDFDVEVTTNRLLALGDSALTGSNLNQRRMRYDNAGNLTNDSWSSYGSASPGVATRTYDAENRMTSAQDSAGGITNYTYDAEGRRVRRSISGQPEVWQVYRIGGELIAEYAANTDHLSPQKEYGYRNGQLLITATVTAGGWGLPPSFTPPATLVSGLEIKLEHLTELRAAVNELRGHAGLSPAAWTVDPDPQRNVTTIKADQIRQLRTALEDARSHLHLSTGGYAHPTLIENISWIYAIDFQELRDQVLSAWNSSTGGVDVRWLVSDQLGTPRMIFDQSGSLASMSRHDYLPFGEELFGGPPTQPGVGGRTTTQGYSGDSTRQKFTLKERDNETGLDYFGARYYGSTQGRFTSPDPLLSSGIPAEPKSWNRYSYCLNAPLKYVDPQGLIWETQTTVRDSVSTTTYKWVWQDDPEEGWDRVTNFHPDVMGPDGQMIGLRLNPNGPLSKTQRLLEDTFLAPFSDVSDYRVKGFEVTANSADRKFFSASGSVGMMPNQAFDIGLTFPVGGIGGALKAAEGAAVAEGLIGVPEASISRATARLYGMNVGGKPIVNSVEAFGSRAGSLFRGRGPLPNSDLDLFVDMHPSFRFGRSAAHIDRTLGSIAGDFARETGYKLQFTFSKRGLQQTPFLPLK